MSFLGRTLILALHVAIVPACAGAADLGSADPVPVLKAPPPASGWTITVGLEGRYQPAWPGADYDRAVPNPMLDIRPLGAPQHFDAPRDSIGVAVIDTGAFRAGPVGNLEAGRHVRHNQGDLRGLDNVGRTFELGAFAEYWWVPWFRTRSELRQGIGGHHGLVSDLTADVVEPVAPGWTVSGGPRVTFVTTAANQPYFGVDAGESTASGLPVYDARGGLRSVGAGAKARYDINRQWFTHAFVEYQRLEGDAANSPIVVQRGSPNQTMIGLGVGYSFDVPRM
jgi:outer membrane protein